jgi:tetratricopeptide (TPR) repeat protein
MNAMSAKRAADFAALARQLADERSTAADRLTELLRTTPRDAWPRLAENPELHNNGALERLSKEVDVALDRHPSDALLLSALSVSIAESLRENQYPAVVIAQIRAHSWKDRAQALSFNGKHEESLVAIDRADEVLASFGTVAHDRAIVRLVKASVLQNLGRFGESLSLLNECRSIFDEHSDDKLLVHCGINEAAILHRQQHFEEACAVLESLIARANDPATLAAIHNNMAHALIEVGRTIDANVHVSQAVTYLTDSGNHVGALRAELATGRLLATKGRTTEALVRLRTAQRSFALRGLREEAALCGLDVAAALLAENRASEARTAFESVRAELPDANGRAQTALVYLADQFEAHDATPAVVRHVAEYLTSIRAGEAREFIALA